MQASAQETVRRFNDASTDLEEIERMLDVYPMGTSADHVRDAVRILRPICAKWTPMYAALDGAPAGATKTLILDRFGRLVRRFRATWVRLTDEELPLLGIRIPMVAVPQMAMTTPPPPLVRHPIRRTVSPAPIPLSEFCGVPRDQLVLPRQHQPIPVQDIHTLQRQAFAQVQQQTTAQLASEKIVRDVALQVAETIGTAVAKAISATSAPPAKKTRRQRPPMRNRPSPSSRAGPSRFSSTNNVPTPNTIKDDNIIVLHEQKSADFPPKHRLAGIVCKQFPCQCKRELACGWTSTDSLREAIEMREARASTNRPESSTTSKHTFAGIDCGKMPCACDTPLPCGWTAMDALRDDVQFQATGWSPYANTDTKPTKKSCPVTAMLRSDPDRLARRILQGDVFQSSKDREPIHVLLCCDPTHKMVLGLIDSGEGYFPLENAIPYKIVSPFSPPSIATTTAPQSLPTFASARSGRRSAEFSAPLSVTINEDPEIGPVDRSPRRSTTVATPAPTPMPDDDDEPI